MNLTLCFGAALVVAGCAHGEPARARSVAATPPTLPESPECSARRAEAYRFKIFGGLTSANVVAVRRVVEASTSDPIVMIRSNPPGTDLIARFDGDIVEAKTIRTWTCRFTRSTSYFLVSSPWRVVEVYDWEAHH
jgi:hypothetical protein